MKKEQEELKKYANVKKSKTAKKSTKAKTSTTPKKKKEDTEESLIKDGYVFLKEKHDTLVYVKDSHRKYIKK